MDDKDVFPKAIASLKKILEILPQGDGSRYLTQVNTVKMFLFDGNSLQENYKKYIPVDQIGTFEQRARNLVFNSIYVGSDFDNYSKGYTFLHDLIVKHCYHQRMKVFYSWQSDLPNSTNRNMIQEALNLAIEELNGSTGKVFWLDSDTRGSSGSPDIVTTILRKIDESEIFVCDVTPTVKNGEDEIPNPNVLFELGYAIKSLGEEKIVMVVNDVGVNLKRIPFDLGFKRQLLYSYAEGGENKANAKKLLARKLGDALKTIAEGKYV